MNTGIDVDCGKIRQLRSLRGWSQAHFAEVAGVSTKTVRRAEQGAKPSLETLKALAAALEVDLTTLVRIPTEQLETAQAVGVLNATTLGPYGALLVALTDVLGEMHHWRRHFADLFQFRSFFYREPNPPLYAALEAAQPLAATVSYQLHRDVADGLASLKRMQRLIASTGGFLRNSSSHRDLIPPNVQNDVRIEGHAECGHVEFYLGRARKELIARVYPESAA